MIDPTTGGLIFKEDIAKFKRKEKAAKTEESKADVVEETKEELDAVNAEFNPKKSTLSIEEKMALCHEVGEEIIKEERLEELLRRKEREDDFFICYDGFEPSGRMHIAQGLMKTANVNRLCKAGGVFYFWVADWFAALNLKFGGDLDKIRVVGKYFVEIWRACGMDLQNVKFLWCSDEINKRPDEYWSMVMDLAQRNNENRIRKCTAIMGRGEDDTLQVSQFFYPCMQATDIFFLKADICQLGLDQRKVNMLAVEYAEQTKRQKPVIISHHMLSGLKEGQAKMSKSDPNSAIFMEDTAADVTRKMKKAYCPPNTTKDNPVFDYVKNIVFSLRDDFLVERDEKWGGDVLYTSYEKCAEDYVNGLMESGDIKMSLARVVNELLQPVRDHFENDPEAKKLLEEVRRLNEEEQKRKASLAKKGKK